MMKRLRWIGLVVALVVLAACSGSQATSTSEPAGDLSFSQDILPLLQEKFAPLLADEPGLQLNSWAGLIAGSEHGAVLIPFDADHSLLIQLAEHRGTDAGITPSEIDRVRRWIEAGARNDAGEVPYADARDLLYVTNQNDATVSVIDADASLVIRTVDLQALGFPENSKPHHTAVEPGGAYWYVSLIGANKVLKFNRDNELVGQADFEVPGMLALDPGSDRLYVGRSMSAVNPPQRIGIIDRNAMSIEEVDVFFPRPHALTVSPNGQIYSASLAENSMASIDPETETVEMESFDEGHSGHPHSLVQFAVAPDGQTMVAGGEMTGTLFFFDLSTPAAPAVAGQLDVNARPWHPTFTPDGRYVYLPNKGDNTVTVIDVPNRKLVKVIEGEGLAEPHGSAISPDGRYVYVSNNNLKGDYTPRYDFGGDPVGTVVVIDTATNEIVKVLEIGHYPTGASARPAR